MVKHRYCCFISHASHDFRIAEAVQSLFACFAEDTFLAPGEIERHGGQEFRQTIIDAIKCSSAFLPIFSKHSARRPWVMYETGAADANSIPIFSARTESIGEYEIQRFASEIPIYKLTDEGSLINLVSFILSTHRGDDYHRTKTKVLEQFEKSDSHNKALKNVILLSRERWVFIAGSLTNVDDHESVDAVKITKKTKKQLQDRVSQYSFDLASKLFESGFSVMSCPQVKFVGQRAAIAYLNYLQSSGIQELELRAHYSIGGLFPIDRDFRKQFDDTASYYNELEKESPVDDNRRVISSDLIKEWSQHIMEFRKSYLRGMEWLVTIGGSVGTTEEIQAARAVGVNICPVPFFGGASKSEWEKIRNVYDRPFARWSEGGAHLPASEVVEYLQSA